MTRPSDDPDGSPPQPMSRERLQAPGMQALIRDAERRAATGRAGEGPTAEELLRLAREQRDLEPRT
jgi:hypothetical protein